MICERCGKYVEGEMSNCPVCGHTLREGTSPSDFPNMEAHILPGDNSDYHAPGDATPFLNRTKPSSPGTTSPSGDYLNQLHIPPKKTNRSRTFLIAMGLVILLLFLGGAAALYFGIFRNSHSAAGAVVEDYLKAWSDKNWDKMVSLTHKDYTPTSEELEAYIQFWGSIPFEVTRIELALIQEDDKTAKFEIKDVVLSLNLGGQIQKVSMDTLPFVPFKGSTSIELEKSKDGYWYVKEKLPPVTDQCTPMPVPIPPPDGG